MKQAYEEVKRALISEKHRYLSEDTLQLCLEAMREHEETKHNGYSNYPTWLVAAWIDNHTKEYNKYSKLLDDLCSEGADDYNIIGVLAQTIKADFDSECTKYQIKTNNTVWSSILNHCQQDLINYREIAKNFIGY